MELSPAHPLYCRRDTLAKGCLALWREDARWLLLSAPEGHGKSSFLRYELTDAAGGTRLFAYDFASEAAADFPRRLAEFAGIHRWRDLADCVGALTSSRNFLFPPILALDNLTHLAADPRNKPFIAELRSALDTHRGVRAIFTSSHPALEQSMFADPKAPFFNFAYRLTLDTDTTAYIDHLHAVMSGFRPSAFPRTVIASIVAALAGNRADINEFILTVMLRAPLDIDAELANHKARIKERHRRFWLALPHAQSAALADIANGAGAYPHGVIVGSRTSALRQLCRDAVLFQVKRGHYQFTSPQLEEAIKH